MRLREFITQSAKPGDIPFFLASRSELVINLKTTKALGLATLVARADELID